MLEVVILKLLHYSEFISVHWLGLLANTYNRKVNK